MRGTMHTRFKSQLTTYEPHLNYNKITMNGESEQYINARKFYES